jgi:hypothetical protein
VKIISGEDKGTLISKYPRSSTHFVPWKKPTVLTNNNPESQGMCLASGSISDPVLENPQRLWDSTY